MVELDFAYGFGEVDTGLIKLESNTTGRTSVQNEYQNQTHSKSNDHGRTQDSEHNWSSNGSGAGPSGTCILEQDKTPVDDSSPCSTASISAVPICRQFWKAGVYNEDSTHVSKTHVGTRINIHPKFLHSNATSHKWAFGAIAELIDNAVDEIQNSATMVVIDKTLNPRNGSSALLIQDDGAGMSPEAMCRCLSFGFSDKKSDSAIGQYGNGFKTSSMRLGADAIVFSRHFIDSTLTQSIGLLSYTFLTRSGYDRIVVPMVHYEINLATGLCEPLLPKSDGHSNSNLSVLLQWSPYSTEEELLNQFHDVGYHGTKIIIYNLWLDDEGNMELDFESDPEDIRIGWDGKSRAKENSLKAKSENHIANRLKFSLRAYLSILYLKLPETFCFLLRGKVVLYYNIAIDLMHPEFILYKAQSGGRCEGSVLTTIGFLKDAPDVNIHGFSIYHKRRLILPFLPVVTYRNNKGRGVVGVLEANFIEPTHNKQDFEKTNVYQKLVNRLREMTNEYWDYHCELIGYQTPRKFQCISASPGCANITQSPAPSKKTASVDGSKSAPIITEVGSRAALYANSPIMVPIKSAPGLAQGYRSDLKRQLHDQPEYYHTGLNTPDKTHNQKMVTVMQQNKILQEKCLELEKTEEELKLKVMQLNSELEEGQLEYTALLFELRDLENVSRDTKQHLYL